MATNQGRFEMLPEAEDSEVQDESASSEMERRHSTVQSLARQFSQHSAVGDVNENPKALFANDDPESPLNPSGHNFSARTWAKTLARYNIDNGIGFRKTGFCFQDLNVFGYGTSTDYQKNLGNMFLEIPNLFRKAFMTNKGQRRIDILRGCDGVVKPGEMLVILGPPGAGCTTFLKAIAGEHNGIYLDSAAYLNYNGITAKEMHTQHKGEAIYTAEVDVHFPMLSVADTLTFASRARCPSKIPPGVTRNQYCDHYRDVVMGMYGITHTLNTQVGNEYIRGVSGGERKRVTIAEATLSYAPLQCWDNSTRGLDSANAIEFCRTLRLQSELFGHTCAVSIYQSPQSAYDLFDKTLLLYEGRQIYFGSAVKAKEYFVQLGFECPDRQTTPDFLTSMTSPSERIVRKGWEGKTPRTPDEFAACWKSSEDYRDLQVEIEAYKKEYAFDGPHGDEFRAHKHASQGKGQRLKSPYTLTYGQQVQLCLWRGWKRLVGNPSLTIFVLIANTCVGFIVSSLFYNLQQDSSSFYGRTAVLFMAILANAFASAIEILTQYSQRPIVEKHDRYGFYHPSSEAFASVLVDLPYKITNSIFYNLTIYFMTNLRREPGAFFFFWFVSLLMVMAMSGLFRSIASLSRTLSQAMVPASILMLAMVIFTGFVIPVDYMLGWCRWINYLDPVAYGYEALMINEFSGRTFKCSSFVPMPSIPGYENVSLENMACTTVGTPAGVATVSGDDYYMTQYSYLPEHKWRNVGILIAFVIGLHLIYFAATEWISAKKSKGEVLVFRRGHVPQEYHGARGDIEASVKGPATIMEKMAPSNGSEDGVIQGSTSVFHWSKVCYDIKIKGEPRRILDKIDGWVKPGTLTALMGVSGAGKTTLLDCLADRVGMGVISGDILVDGHVRDASFQRKTGYVQQQDLHLETTTVREALEFSALLRQPNTTPRPEKLAYVDEVIKLLDMQAYADAVVGVLGEGLNVEQRKRLTIGVELAAKPPLLLFVDEPTSGLDSQTSWSILDLLEKLSKAGQSVLCTIHQPSAMLFQRFDRLLFLAEGGKTVYFGDIGKGSETMTSYFERHGAPKCLKDENPAEWMLEAIGAAPGATTEVDWHQTWLDSPEYDEVQTELEHLISNPVDHPDSIRATDTDSEFASPLWPQLLIVSHRVFQQYWRTPSYISSKFTLLTLISLFIGLVLIDAPLSIQGLQNQMFALFNILSVFGQIVQQQMPYFVTQRSLYEVRERPSKTYSWMVFIVSQLMAEIPWNTIVSVLMFVCVYYPVGFQRNAAKTDTVVERGGLMWLLFWQFLLFTSTFAHACIAPLDTAEGGGNVANILFMMCLFFCGVMATSDMMPRFWIFMYRVNPFTYWVSSVLSTGLANQDVQCARNELVKVHPPDGLTCGKYLEVFAAAAGGKIVNPDDTDSCLYCPMSSTNSFLDRINSNYDNRWRDFGLGFAFIAFNIAAAIFLYWLVRMPKGRKKQ
ncbi:unnamed protein product [Clonostachys chloroleuca]|uniref:ABC transporter domain-containing protein n=1 Tax=Clonostachys chloroleuca TaxID=1926264 RepID=A0AA35MC84_9HYPO|nr:unnamed protein product [Clonostachys chloroleuca]